jgi:hypothetical protein
VAVVALTALLIWMLRPGTAGVPGTGGVAHRQPRAALLVAVSLIAVVVVLVYVRTSGRWQQRTIIAMAGGVIAIIIIDIVAAIFWPGGLLRHYQSFNPSTNISVPSTTAANGAGSSTTTPPTTIATTTSTG